MIPDDQGVNTINSQQDCITMYDTFHLLSEKENGWGWGSSHASLHMQFYVQHFSWLIYASVGTGCINLR